MMWTSMCFRVNNQQFCRFRRKNSILKQNQHVIKNIDINLECSRYSAPRLKLPNPFMHSFLKRKPSMYMQTTKVNQMSVKHQQRFAHVFLHVDFKMFSLNYWLTALKFIIFLFFLQNVIDNKSMNHIFRDAMK